jgi:ribonuclease Z
VGYRFDYRGRSIVVSGDTAKCANLVRVSSGVDLLVHEALAPDLVAMMETAARAGKRPTAARIFHDIPSYHTSPPDAADEATQAHAGALAFTHIIPPLPFDTLEDVFLGDARQRFRGPLFIARDGDLASLPVGGGAMRRRNLFIR